HDAVEARELEELHELSAHVAQADRTPEAPGFELQARQLIDNRHVRVTTPRKRPRRHVDIATPQYDSGRQHIGMTTEDSRTHLWEHMFDGGRGHDPARRPRLVLRVGRAAGRPDVARA